MKNYKLDIDWDRLIRETEEISECNRIRREEENISKPLFTLTAEEVEKEEQIIGAALLKYHEFYNANKQTSTASDWKEAIDYCHKQLTRIKQWKDENNIHNSML